MNIFKILFLISPVILGCKNVLITEADAKIEVGAYDSFPRTVPHDASLFSYYQKGDRHLKVQYKTLQKVFFVKQRTKPLKKIHTKDLLTFGIIDQERIYGIDSDSIYIYDLMNNTTRSIYLNNRFTYKGNIYVHFTGIRSFYHLALSSDRKKLFIPTVSWEYNWWKEQCFRIPGLVSEIDLETGKKKVLDFIKYPDEYLKNFYGEDFGFDYTVNDKDELILSFQAMKNLYVYDLKKKKLKKEVVVDNGLSVKPPFDKRFLEDIATAINYNFSTTSYYSITYEPTHQIYFRTCLTPTSNEKRKKEGVSYFSKFDLYIFAYDKELKEIWRHNFGDSLNFVNFYLTQDKFSMRSFKPSKTYEYFQNISIN